MVNGMPVNKNIHLPFEELRIVRISFLYNTICDGQKNGTQLKSRVEAEGVYCVCNCTLYVPFVRNVISMLGYQMQLNYKNLAPMVIFCRI